jgi:hypothetical protein
MRFNVDEQKCSSLWPSLEFKHRCWDAGIEALGNRTLAVNLHLTPLPRTIYSSRPTGLSIAIVVAGHRPL